MANDINWHLIHVELYCNYFRFSTRINANNGTEILIQILVVNYWCYIDIRIQYPSYLVQP